jgi:ATP-dependent protease ClpP protease subunit
MFDQINGLGGHNDAGLAINDTMVLIEPQVATTVDQQGG